MKSLKPILQKQHVLYKPQVYLGTIREVKEQLWIIQQGKAVLKSIFYVPAILKIYDELLINAVQHKTKDDSTSFIQITVKDNGIIVITNNGKSLPLDLISQQTYAVQSIFGQEQQTSQYYRMGYSVKLVNIMSKHFFVETGSKNRQIAIKIDWKDNMMKMDSPQTCPYTKFDYTKISAMLDLQKLGVKKLSADFIGLLHRRAYDIAALNRLKVYFNEKEIVFSSLNQYAELFASAPNQIYCDTDSKSLRWKVIMIKSVNFQQMSFVNNCIWTKNGGTHVNYVISQIATRALQMHRKRLRNPAQVMSNPQKFKSNYMLIVSIFIENPAFNSVTKDALISPINKLQPLYYLSESGLDFLQKNKQLQSYKEMAKQRDNQKLEQQHLRKITKSNIVVPKLDDAYNVGISSRCILIITQNDSIRQSVSYGLQCANRDYFGIYTPKNRLSNARQMNSKQMTENSDFSAIVKALGLTIGKTYENIDQLRYSTVLIIAGNDLEGVSFKGLMLNFFESFWPSLLKIKGFAQIFIPPIVRCTDSFGNVKQFLTETQFANWSSSNSPNQWTPTYYRGIASMNPNLMKQVFAQRKKYCFSYLSLLDEDSLRNIYTKKPNEAKKKWLEQYNPSAVMEYNTNSKIISIKDFVDKQLIHYFYNENIQVVPSSLDGLNKIQRRVLNCLFRIGVGRQIKISNLLGMVLQSYGNYCPDSLIQNNIISLGQCFVGSNNLNLIEPIGQFGTRFMNGKDSAPSRYLLTSLPTLTRLLFPSDDQYVLQYHQDGVQKQPRYYVPIIPLIMVNGYGGLDNLWSSFVHPHKVSEIIDLTKEKIIKQKVCSSLMRLHPSWEGFKGSVNSQKKGVYQVKGCYQIRPNNTVIINEIPPNKSYKQYKTFLQSKTGDPDTCEIQDFKQEQRGSKLTFILKFHPTKMPPQSQLEKYLKITYNLQDGPMTLMQYSGKFKKYENLSQIFQEYYQIRLRLYEKRKEFLMSRLIRNIELVSQKSRFIKEVLNGEFNLSQSQQIWRARFIRKSYKKYQNLQKINATNHQQQSFIDFQYLQKLTIHDFSQRKIFELQSEKEEYSNQLNLLKKTTQKQMWLKEIQIFQQGWKQFNRAKDHQYHQSLRKVESLFKKEPSQPSINKKKSHNYDDISQISLGSQVYAELQKQIEQPPNIQSKTHIPPNNVPPPPPHSKQDLVSKDHSIKTEADTKIQKRQFDQMIRQMQKGNYEYQQRMKRETRRSTIQKQRQRQLQKIKKDKQHKEKEQKLLLQAKQNQKNREEKTIVQKEANHRREALGKHAQEIGKKVEEDRRKQNQQKDRSQKSQRNHLPQPDTPTPRITVPFKCDSSTFQVNHVERKRFPSRSTKNDQVDLNKIAAQLRRKQDQQQKRQQMRINRISACIDLDAD